MGAEANFAENTFEPVKRAIQDAEAADSVAGKIHALTELRAVEVEQASAFLFFMHPAEYLIVSETEWEVLHDAGRLNRSYPVMLDVEAYESYLGTCRRVAETEHCGLVELYRALRQLASSGSGV